MAVHSAFLIFNRVDIPYWDEWELFKGIGISKIFDLSFLISRHNEHRIVTTKLVFWLDLFFEELNFGNLVIVNWVLFCSYIAVYIGIYQKTKVLRDKFKWNLFFIFFFSMANWENLFWSFQMAFHFAIGSLIVAISICFSERFSRSFRALALIVTSLVGVYSFSLGIPFMLGVGIFSLIFEVYLSREFHLSFKQWIGFMVPYAISLSGMLLWFFGDGTFRPVDNAIVSPFEARFWLYYLPLIGSGLVAHQAEAATFVGGIILVGFLFFLWWSLKNHQRLSDLGIWPWLALGTGVFSALAMISMGRADYGPQQALSIRYTGISMLLIPLIAVILSCLLEYSSVITRNRVYFIVFGLMFISFFKKWDYMKYDRVRQDRLRDRQCLAETLRNDLVGNCPYYFPSPLGSRLRRAEQLGVRFTKSLTSGKSY